ncbi:MAG: family transposase [Paenibacillus sp.]|jgi:transposase|nr:family transposase [Paenibacillus sp.]
MEQELNMYQVALGIEEPWYVSYRDLDMETLTLHVGLNFRRGAEFACPNCGKSCKVFDVVDEDRMWRHLNFWQYQTVLHARLPRVKCGACGKVLTVIVDWARPQAGLTWRFESYVMELMKEMPVAAVAREVNEHDTRLWRVLRYYVDRAMAKMDMTHVKRIAIDETSSRRGHQYITLFVDVDTKKLLFATEGKGADGLLTFRSFLSERNVDAGQIEEFCCDMSAAFISGIEQHFPKASITFDKFHVMKMVNESVDQVRREEQKEVDELKKSRYVWLKNEDNLTPSQKEKLVKLKDMNLLTGRAYRIKLALQEMYPALLADLYFSSWYRWAVRSQINPMVEVAKSLKRHEEGILRWFRTKMTNGLLEGLNSLVQATKRKARGFRTVDNFIAMAYVTVNKLKITVQQPQ